MKKTAEEFYRLVNMPAQKHKPEAKPQDEGKENRDQPSTAASAGPKPLKEEHEQDLVTREVARLLAEQDRLKGKYAELNHRHQDLLAWKKAKLAEGEAARARQKVADLCPKCREDIGWTRLTSQEWRFGMVLLHAYKTCPRCGYQERMPREGGV